MYFDTLKTADYRLYPKAIGKALDWLKAQNFETLPAGRHELGGQMYAQVIDADTQLNDQVLPERHRNYIDVQYVYRGTEMMGVAIETGNYELAKEYDPNRDILYYQKVENESLIEVQAGQFAVFFPNDVHRPAIAKNNQPERTRKIVVKVPVAQINDVIMEFKPRGERLMEKLTKINKGLEALVVANLAIMTAMVFLNVILRYGFNSGITMTEELSRVLFVWLTFIGAVLAFSHDEHVSVNFLVQKLPNRFLALWSLITDGILFLLASALVVGCYQLTVQNWSNLMPITGIPRGINYLAGLIMAVMFMVMIASRFMIISGAIKLGDIKRLGERS